MNREEKINSIREKLRNTKPSIGSWMQIPSPDIAEILSHSNYDWIAVDLEHGSFALNDLPNIFRAIESSGSTLALARLSHLSAYSCKSALDAGAGGVIVPKVESKADLDKIKEFSFWPPSGSRGVGFSRANLFGKKFTEYKAEAQSPLLVAMIESVNGVKNLDQILSSDCLDAIFIGPYDLSASMGITGEFNNKLFMDVILEIENKCLQHKKANGIHIVENNPSILQNRIDQGYQFIAYSIDGIFLNSSANNPQSENNNVTRLK